jgi:hypothetical protein
VPESPQKLESAEGEQPPQPASAEEPPQPDSGEERPPLRARVRRLLVGRPRDLQDRRLFHRLSLIPFLAWVGLGADGGGYVVATKLLGENAGESRAGRGAKRSHINE